jgi:hypothetical protein
MARAKNSEETSAVATLEPRKVRTEIVGVVRISPKLDVRLTAIARSEGKRKGRFLEEILDKALRRYKFDEALRSALGVSASEEAPEA